MDEVPRQLSNQNWRVKVYLLNEAGNWDDCGAGILEIVKETKMEIDMDFLKVTNTNDPTKNNPVTVTPEKLQKIRGDLQDDSYILYLPILKENQYEKQGDTIISWIDENLKEEIAISCIDTSVAKETWRTICYKIGKNPNEERKNQYKDLDQLPMPTMDNLDQIKSDLTSKKDWMICAILENKTFLDKLFQIFRDYEDLEGLEYLHTIHSIVRLMIFSEDVNLLELLLSDEYYLLVFGALEYDSEIPGATRPRYREFLQNQAYYKKVIDFQDDQILQKIRLNYRISYLKDSVISSIMDDPLTSQFNPISYITNKEILEHIMSNDHYIDELFGKMTSQLKDAIGFLYELTQIAKMMVQIDEKIGFCKKLIKKNVFNVIAKALETLYSPAYCEETDDKINITKINLVDILTFLIQLDLNAFIEFLKSSPDSKTMITGIINNLFYGDQGLQIQTGELIKYLIDTIHERKNEILDIFYDNFMPAFVEHYKKLENNEKFYSYVQQLIEILIHCIKSHGYRIRHYIIHHKLLQKLYPGFKTREKSLHLALIRLIKNIALSKDEFLIKYIANNNLLDDVFELYVKNAFKNNLLNSTCLEFFDIIRKQNIKKLIVELTEKFRDRIRDLDLERFFEKLFLRYDQITEDMNKESSQEPSEAQPGAKLPISTVISENFENYNSRELSYMEDEEYFEGEDDDEDMSKSKAAPTTTHAEKSNGSSSAPKTMIEEPAQAPESPLSDEQLKASKDSLQKMKEKIAAKKKQEAEEDSKFVFGNRARSKSPSVEKPGGLFNIQFSFPVGETNENSSSDELNGKREGSDLQSDEDIKDDGKVDPQKKIKL